MRCSIDHNPGGYTCAARLQWELANELVPPIVEGKVYGTGDTSTLCVPHLARARHAAQLLVWPSAPPGEGPRLGLRPLAARGNPDDEAGTGQHYTSHLLPVSTQPLADAAAARELAAVRAPCSRRCCPLVVSVLLCIQLFLRSCRCLVSDVAPQRC